MNGIRKILLVTGAFLLVVVIVGVFLPSTGRVERELAIDAPAATVFALINDFRRRREWSPPLDPDGTSRVEFAGPARGVGATVRWSGGSRGAGSETIVESEPFERVASEIDRANERTARSVFLLRGAESRTVVLWTFEVEFGIDLRARYAGLLLDRALGHRHEAALAELRSMAESLPRADFSDIEIDRMEVEPQRIAWQRTRSLPNAAAISEAVGDAYFEVLSFIDRQGLQVAGPPLSISRARKGAEIIFDAAIPVQNARLDVVEPDSPVQLGRSYGGPVVRAAHRGSYATLGRTHEKIMAYLAAHGMERSGDPWESYESDPARTAAADLLTYVYYPVKDDEHGTDRESARF